MRGAELSERGSGGVLVGAGAPAHGGDGCGGVESAGDEPLGDGGAFRDTHEDHDGGADLGEGLPVDGSGAALLAVAGDHGERGRDAAVGDRDAGGCGHAHRRGDAGHHGELEAGGHEGLGLLAAASEHEGVATFEAHDVESLTAQMHEQRVDGLLRGGTPGALADIDDLGVGPAEGEDRTVGEMVVDDDVGPGDETGGAHGEQFGIAGTGPHEMHGHGAATSERMANPLMP